MSRQRNFRFTEEMESHLNEIDQWFNSTDKNFDFKASKTELIDFCLYQVKELFVNPFTENNQNTFDQLKTKYQRTKLHNQVPQNKQNQFILKQLAIIKLLILNNSFLPEIDQLKSNHDPESIPYFREQKILHILKKDFEERSKKQNR